jgi:hypothetical protein
MADREDDKRLLDEILNELISHRFREGWVDVGSCFTVITPECAHDPGNLRPSFT